MEKCQKAPKHKMRLYRTVITSQTLWSLGLGGVFWFPLVQWNTEKVHHTVGRNWTHTYVCRLQIAYFICVWGPQLFFLLCSGSPNTATTFLLVCKSFRLKNHYLLLLFIYFFFLSLHDKWLYLTPVRVRVRVQQHKGIIFKKTTRNNL